MKRIKQVGITDNPPEMSLQETRKHLAQLMLKDEVDKLPIRFKFDDLGLMYADLDMYVMTLAEYHKLLCLLRKVERQLDRGGKKLTTKMYEILIEGYPISDDLKDDCDEPYISFGILLNK